MNQFFTVLKMITEVPVQLWSNEDVNSLSKAQKKIIIIKKKTGVRKSSYKGHHLDALM